MSFPTIRGLTFDYFSTASKEVKNPLESKPITFWAVGIGGEVGELLDAAQDAIGLAIACGKLLNVAKKIERDQAWQERIQRSLDEQMLSEAGDVLFYIDKTLKKRGLTLNMAAVYCIHKLERMRAELTT